MATMDVPLQLAGGSFETSLGATSSVTVVQMETDDREYRVKLTSNVDHEQEVRIGGWKLKGRKDRHVLRAREADKVVKGALPH